MRAVLVAVALAYGCSSPRTTTAVPPPPPMPPADATAIADAPSVVVRADAAGSSTPTPTVTTVADPAKVKGYAYVPPQGLVGANTKGAITTITAAAPADGRIRWTVVVTDASVKPHPFVVELPAEIAMPVAVGARVTVDASVKGGGPNAIGMLAITDDHGLALTINLVPAGWSVDFGKQLSVDKGSTYDEHTHAASVRPSSTAPAVEVVSSGWRAVVIAGQRFYGTGTAVKRDLHRKPPPPDYVGSWIDFTLIRVP